MNTTAHAPPQQATKLCTGADIKAAKPGARLRFGGGLYLLVSPTGTKSWQVHYHVGRRHQATIVGRWPELGIEEAKRKRNAIRETVREGGDPAHDRQERRTARQTADATSLRAVAETWLSVAEEARGWSAYYAAHTQRRLVNHVFPTLGERPIGRITTQEVEALIFGLLKPTADRPGLRSQAVHVRQALQLLFDYALRRKLVTENPVRVIAEDLPKRVRGDERELPRNYVETIADARDVLAIVEASAVSPFAKLCHRLIALTAVRKLEALHAQWPEITEGPDGMTWTIPAARMKGRRGQKLPHVIPLSPQAADVFRAARALAAAMGFRGDAVFPSLTGASVYARAGLNALYTRAGLVGRHTVHGWRATFSTLCNEADPGAYRLIDVMLAHRAFGQVERRYNHATFLDERRRLATAWAERLLVGAPEADVLAGLRQPGNVVALRRVA